jgi:putative addiction module killer protein
MMMLTIHETETFADWLKSLRDGRARARIASRVQRLSLGNPGDAKSVGSGVLEMRIDYGPGYRVYYTEHGKRLVILLCGGDKSTQAKDIKQAIRMAGELKA